MNDRLFCYYGDDFTGSTDVLEALAANGVSAILLLDAIEERQLSGYQAIGMSENAMCSTPFGIIGIHT